MLIKFTICFPLSQQFSFKIRLFLHPQELGQLLAAGQEHAVVVGNNPEGVDQNHIHRHGHRHGPQTGQVGRAQHRVQHAVGHIGHRAHEKARQEGLEQGLHAGDIGAIAKLATVATGDTLSTKNTPILYGKTEISTPYTYKRYKTVNKGDEDKVSQALNRMMQEDLTLKVVNDSQNRQTLLYGIGEQHLDIVVSKLKERYKVDIVLSEPKVPFKETIRKKADVEAKYKKQSGGHGQYGHVKMIFEPSGDLETPYVFEQTVVGGAVPKNYFPAVEKGVQESVAKGPLASYPVVGVKATLYDGSYHPVDSSEMAFKTAAIQAFKKGFMEASPVLLEPIVSMKVSVPDKFTGDVMGDLNKRRGRVLGMNPDTEHKGNTVIEADVPMLSIYGYSTDLRSMTGGSGLFSYEFSRYEQAPSDIQEKEIAARAKAEED